MNIAIKTTAAVMAAAAISWTGAGVASAAPADVQGEIHIFVYDNATGAQGDLKVDADVVEGWTVGITEVVNGNYMYISRDMNGRKYAGPHFGLTANQGPSQNTRYNVQVLYNDQNLWTGTMGAGTSKVMNFDN